MSSSLDKQCDLLWRSITYQFDCKRQFVLAGHECDVHFLVSEQFMGRYHRQQCHNSDMNPRGCILVMCSSDAEVQEPVIYMVTVTFDRKIKRST